MVVGVCFVEASVVELLVEMLGISLLVTVSVEIVVAVETRA